MKKIILVSIAIILIFSSASNLLSQSTSINREFGLTLGGFTNFPANKHYLKDNIKVFNLASYIIIGKHEFYAGIVYPLNAKGLYSGWFAEQKLIARPGATAGYKFYIFNKAGRENMYVNYSFQYLRFTGNFTGGPRNDTYSERDYDINNVFSLGYVVYFDTQQRFGLYYSLGYVISQGSYQTTMEVPTHFPWKTQFIWNNINTNVGLSFKLKNFDKKTPKAN